MLTTLQEGHVVLLVARDRKQYLVVLKAGQVQGTNRGTIKHDDLIGRPAGREVHTHMGYPFLVLEAATSDLVRMIKRTTQIMFPKDIGYLLQRLNLFPGRKVIEAGTGSGGLTLALARAVMPAGIVYSYESNPDTQALAGKNLENLGLAPFVKLKNRDIGDGIDEIDVDALFLDLRHPWRYLQQAAGALKAGGFFGAILPTVNQVAELLDALQAHGEFAFTEVEELLLRPYKAVPARLRPADRMIAHTGFLIFARKIAGGLDAGWALTALRRRRVALEREGEERRAVHDEEWSDEDH